LIHLRDGLEADERLAIDYPQRAHSTPLPHTHLDTAQEAQFHLGTKYSVSFIPEKNES
jgi:hypothetical protein